MMQLLDFFKRQQFEITFATTAHRSRYTADLEGLGIKTVGILLNDVSFDHFLKDLDPEVVLFDRFMMEEQFGWRVTDVCPGALKILDTEDLHFLRKIRETSFKKGISEEELLHSSEAAKREVASIYRCDLSLIISKAEMNLLQETFKIDPGLLVYLPFLYEKIREDERFRLPSFSERAHFISIGNFLHEPNWNAVLFLKEKIWPQLKEKVPNAEMHIYGAYPSEKVFNLHNSLERFLVKGRAESVETVMQYARVCLAPLQFGAGLKGKFFDAMRSGTPCVTTAIGAEGIAGSQNWNGYIEDEPEAFVKAAFALYTKEDLWQEARRKGFHIMNSCFSRDGFEESFLQRLNGLRKDLENHRKNNFVGAMLQHHQHRSTYFMSKYIELKNSRK